MKIVCGEAAGFCPGVQKAIDTAKEELKKGEPVYCLGEMVHNKVVINDLCKQGLVMVKEMSEVPGGFSLMIRTHGAPKEVYEEAERRGLKLIDLTCTKVKKVQSIAETYYAKGYRIIITGERDHPEVIGIRSHAGPDALVVSTIEELLEVDLMEKSCLIAQTTFSTSRFDALASYALTQNRETKVIHTICHTTSKRQEEASRMAEEVDLMIIMGDEASSNSKQLYEIAKRKCTHSLFVQDVEEVDPDKIRVFEKIGVMANASTPSELVSQMIQKIMNGTI